MKVILLYFLMTVLFHGLLAFGSFLWLRRSFPQDSAALEDENIKSALAVKMRRISFLLIIAHVIFLIFLSVLASTGPLALLQAVRQISGGESSEMSLVLISRALLYSFQFFGLFIILSAIYPFDKRLYGRTWRFGNFLVLSFGALLFLRVMQLLFIAGSSALSHASDMIFGIGMAVLLLVFFLAVASMLPLYLILIWRCKRMEDSPMKERFRQMLEANGLKDIVIVIWPTRHAKIANAFAGGLMPGLRRILLSTELLDSVGEKEADAIFAHEVGHHKHRHLLKLIIASYVFLIVGCALVAFGMAALSEAFLPVPFFGGIVLVLVMNGFFSLWLSRRFEFQADRFAAVQTGDTESVIEALKIIYGVSIIGEESKHFWWLKTHPLLSKRVEALRHIDNANRD